MKSLNKIIYSPIAFDIIFAGAGIISIGGMTLTTGNDFPEIEAAVNPLAKGLSLVGVVLASTVMAIGSTRIDQKMADDFLFASLTKSAFIAMMALLFVATIWELLLQNNLGAFNSYTMLGVAVAAWSLGWFYTRIRGTRP